MGHFTTSCAVSGLPVEYKSKAVCLFVTRNKFSEHSSCYPWSEFIFASFPIIMTMDEYGGSNSFGDNADADKVEALQKQVAYRILFNSVFETELGKSDDWYRKLLRKEAGVIRYLNTFEIEKLQKVDPCFIRYDVWKWMLARGIKDTYFQERLDEVFNDTPPANLSMKDREEFLLYRPVRLQCEFLTADLCRLLTRKVLSNTAGKAEYKETITDKEQAELKKSILDMSKVVSVLGLLGKKIERNIHVVPQDGYSEPIFKSTQKSFHKFCLKSIDSDMANKDW